MCITCRQQFLRLDLEVLVEQHGTIFHIVDVSTDLIHAVCRLNGHHIVYSRTGEATVWQVYGFITAVSQENLLHSHAFHLRQFLLHLHLQRIWIAIQRIVIRILIGIQEYTRLHALILIACRRIGFQVPDIRTCQTLQIKRRGFQAFASERLQTHRHSIAMSIQLLIGSHHLHGMSDVAYTLCREFLIRELTIETIQIHAIISFRIAIRWQCMIGTRGIVARTLASIAAQKH